MEPMVDQIHRCFVDLGDLAFPSTTKHVTYNATVQLDSGSPYRIGATFYVYENGVVDLSVNYARRMNARRCSPPSVVRRIHAAILAHEERTCWTCLRKQMIGPNNETCSTCNGVGVHRG